MTPTEIKEKYVMLYNYMATSNKPEYMKVFGRVMNEMMDWFIQNKPDAAREWVEKLCSIKWNNYLTEKEAETIVANMEPKAPWNYAVWKSAMEQNGFAAEKEPCYNTYALWAAMNMVMSDSNETLSKYVSKDELLNLVYDLAVDKLTDKDGVFKIRRYFELD